MSELPPDLPERKTSTPQENQNLQDPNPNPENPSEFKRFIKHARQEAKRGGDVNVAHVGQAAQVDQLAVGRNILQAKINIGTLVIPVRFLLVLLVVALVVVVAVWWIATPGQMPPGGATANVAIVEFGQEDAQGNVSSSAQGAYISQWLYNRLDDEIAALPVADRPAFWHIATGFDPMHLFQKRVTSQPIRNEADAAKLAQQLNARIVIYGNLKQGESTESFAPQIYIQQAQGEADELGGSQQVGSPIPLAKNVNDEELRQNLLPLGQGLVVFSRALQNDLNGRHDLAYQVLAQGAQDLEQWDEAAGKEVLFYFLGREALFSANCLEQAEVAFAGSDEPLGAALDKAEASFQKAQDIAQRNNRTYARATFGLAQVALQRAQRQFIPPGSKVVGQCRINLPPPPADPTSVCPAPLAPPTDPAVLERALAYANRSIDLFELILPQVPVSAASRLYAKVNGAYAAALLFRGQVQLLQQQRADAEASYQNVITRLNDLQSKTPADDRRTLSELQLVLGTTHLYAGGARLMANDVAGARASVIRSIDAFNTCKSLIPRDDPDVLLRSTILPNCICTGKSANDFLGKIK